METLIGVSVSMRPLLNFSLTTRDGNNCRMWEGTIFPFLNFSLTTRDGNQMEGKTIRLRKGNFSLTTRDGNSAPAVLSPAEQKKFQPNYKGWKHEPLSLTRQVSAAISA